MQKGVLTTNDIFRLFGHKLLPDGDDKPSGDLKFGYGNLGDSTLGGCVKVYKASDYNDKGIIFKRPGRERLGCGARACRCR